MGVQDRVQATGAQPLGATTLAPALPAARAGMQATTVFTVLAGVSVAHCLNDLIQSLLPAIYPVLKEAYRLDFGQIGLLTLAFQLTASLLQPAVGLFTDRKPLPYSLPAGFAATLAGLLLLSSAHSYAMLVVASALIGTGSAVFHPEASRVARMASGGRHGLAQSLFQVGGNCGSAIGPLLAAFIVVPRGQGSVAWFSLAALLGMAVLGAVGTWYARRLRAPRAVRAAGTARQALPRRTVVGAVLVLLALIFSKYFYMAALQSFYTFYLIERFGVSVQSAQLLLFLFLGAVALGVLAGGPIGDRIGRKRVIWFSILGILPFTLALPYANLVWTAALTVPIGLILASAFSAILVYAQELMPGRVGTVSGLFFGFAFGMGGLGAAVLGELADHTSVEFVFRACAFLPLIGLLTALLPDVERRAA